MKNPTHFKGVLVVGMLVVASLYLTMGALGYWSFGTTVLGSITLNLPCNKNSDWYSRRRNNDRQIMTYPLLGFIPSSNSSMPAQYFFPIYCNSTFLRILLRWHSVGLASDNGSGLAELALEATCLGRSWSW